MNLIHHESTGRRGREDERREEKRIKEDERREEKTRREKKMREEKRRQEKTREEKKRKEDQNLTHRCSSQDTPSLPKVVLLTIHDIAFWVDVDAMIMKR